MHFNPAMQGCMANVTSRHKWQ